MPDNDHSAALMGSQGARQRRHDAAECLMPRLGSGRVRMPGMVLGRAAEPVDDLVPVLAVGRTTVGLTESWLGGDREAEHVRNDRSGLGRPEPWRGVQNAIGAASVLASEPRGQPRSLVPPQRAQPGAAALAANRVGEVALSLTMAGDDELGGDPHATAHVRSGCRPARMSFTTAISVLARSSSCLLHQ